MTDFVRRAPAKTRSKMRSVCVPMELAIRISHLPVQTQKYLRESLRSLYEITLSKMVGGKEDGRV